MSNTVTLKRGDTRTAIKATLLEPSGLPVNLTGATVRFIMSDSKGQGKINRMTEIKNATAGYVWFVFEPGDTDIIGLYRAEFEVIFGDGRKETYPNSDYIFINIISDLG